MLLLMIWTILMSSGILAQNKCVNTTIAFIKESEFVNDVTISGVFVDANTSLSAATSFRCRDFLPALRGQTLVVQNAFNLDDILKGSASTIECKYVARCSNNGMPDEGFSIVIIDENDERPYFDQGTNATVLVDEMLPINLEIISLKGKLLDDDYDDRSYPDLMSLLLDNDSSSFFEVDQESKSIKLIKQLDYELGERIFNITLKIKDRANLESQPFLMTVIVKDRDDQPPMFSRSYYNVDTQAKSWNVSSCISTEPKIIANDGDFTLNAGVNYAIVEVNGDKGGHPFDMNCPKLGEIRLLSPLDLSKSTEFHVTVRATQTDALDRASYSYVFISVQPPLKMSKDAHAVQIQEDLLRGSLVLTLDVPTAKNNVSCELIDPSSSFELLHVKGQPFASVVVSHQASLDRETKDIYILTLICNAEGADAVQSVITVNVSDVNDNAPAFNATQVLLAVRDGELGPDREAVVVRVDDPDLGYNGNLSLHLEGEAQTFFRVSTTKVAGGGVIVTVRPEVSLTSNVAGVPHTSNGKAVYMFDVVASDQGTPVLTARCRVRIFVRPPEPLIANQVYPIVLQENQVGESILAKVVVLHDDEDNVLFSLRAGNDDNAFSVDGLTGAVKILRPLDRETEQVRVLQVEARWADVSGGATVPPKDAGDTNNTAFVVISVLDVNEAPYFVRNLSSFCLVDVPIGTTVIYVNAFDPDPAGTANSQLSYHVIACTSSCPFEINATTGEVKTTALLPKDTLAYELEVRVSDNGSPSLNGSTWLRVSIISRQEPKLMFPKNIYYVTVEEGISYGSSIFSVNVSVDGIYSRDVRYDIMNEDTPFVMTSGMQGEILTNGVIDREDRATWHLLVRARHTGTPSNSTSFTQVIVHVNDVNDNAPSIEGPRNQNGQLEAHVYDSAAVRTLVKCIYASDADEPGTNNSIVKYFITENDFLSIDADSGQVRLASRVRNGTDSVLVEVTATDMGQPALTSNRTSLLVTVVKDVGAGIRFAEPEYSASIPEDSKNGTTVITVTAKVNGTISPSMTYSVVSGTWLPFSINETSGAVSVNGQLDRESKASWTFSVVAFDDKVRFYTAYAVVTVNVSDVNDNAPTFRDSTQTPAVFEANIFDNAPLGALVLCVYADDADEPGTKNSLVRYSLSGSNKLSIDDKTGHVTVAASLRGGSVHTIFGPEEIYAVVNATDCGDVQLHTSAMVKVTIAKTDALNIIFIPDVYEANIIEGNTSGEVVITVAAYVNGTRSETTLYSIEDESVPFAVNNATGSISLTRNVSGYDGQRWTFQVTANDRKSAGNTAYALVRVQLLLASPAFAKSHYIVTLPENAMVPANLTRVEAKVTGQRRVVYKIVSGDQGVFIIDAHTGVLGCIKQVDREINSTFTLEIGATYDSGEDSNSYSVATVEVRILDVNDNPPRFSSEMQTFGINGNATKGAIIGTIKATDADECANIAYEISDKNFTFFAIDAKTGTITLNQDRFPPSSAFEAKAVDLCENGQTLSVGILLVKVELVHPVTTAIAMGCFDWRNAGLKLERQASLSKAVGSNVIIHGFEPTTNSADACLQALVYAVSTDKGTLMPVGDLDKILGEKKSDIEKIIGSPIRPVATNENDSTPVYALAAVAAFLFVTSIALAVKAYRQRNFAARSRPPRSEYTNGRTVGYSSTPGAGTRQSGPDEDIALPIHLPADSMQGYNNTDGAARQNASNGSTPQDATMGSTPPSYYATFGLSSIPVTSLGIPLITLSAPAVSEQQSNPSGQTQSQQSLITEANQLLPVGDAEPTQVPGGEQRRSSEPPVPSIASQAQQSSQQPQAACDAEPTQVPGGEQRRSSEPPAPIIASQAQQSSQQPQAACDAEPTQVPGGEQRRSSEPPVPSIGIQVQQPSQQPPVAGDLAPSELRASELVLASAAEEQQYMQSEKIKRIDQKPRPAVEELSTGL